MLILLIFLLFKYILNIQILKNKYYFNNIKAYFFFFYFNILNIKILRNKYYLKNVNFY